MKVLINVGPSGCGKTSFSKKLMKIQPTYIRINRDDIRKVFVGELDHYYFRRDLDNLEKLVTNVEEHMFMNLLRSNRNVIIDNTNLKPQYITKWIDLAEKLSVEDKTKHEIKILFHEIPLNLARNRVGKRENIEDENRLTYITKQFLEFANIKNYVKEFHKEKIIKEGDDSFK